MAKYEAWFQNDDGTPATGLTPTFNYMVVRDTSVAVDPQPAITESGGGWYIFSSAEGVTVLATLDGGDTLTGSNRYTPGKLTANDENLDAAVSSRSTFDNSSDTVTTDAASRTASQADVSVLATQTSVNTVNGVVDSVLAILSGTGTELTGTPDKTASLDDRIQLMFMALRNAVISQDGSQTIANDAGDAISIATQQVSSGVLTKGKFEDVT